MKINYDIVERPNEITIKIFTYDCLEPIMVEQTITREMVMKAGNVIDRNTFGSKMCFWMLQEFNKKIAILLRSASEYIFNKELNDDVTKYTDAVDNFAIEIITVPMFDELNTKVFNHIQQWV